MKNYKIIDKNRLLHNLAHFKNKKICAMVKSNAYGHGLAQIVDLTKDFVDCFGVVNVEEGIKVRQKTDKPILICAKTFEFERCKKHNLQVLIDSEEDLFAAIDLGLNVNLKIDCGMKRYGLDSATKLKRIDEILEKNNIKLQSICTHFPFTENREETLKNYQNFLSLKKCITQSAPICFGGSGIYDYAFDYDILRLGIGMYGYGKNLFPIEKIVSYVAKVFEVKKGESIGYGSAYVAEKSGLYGIVPVGYGDGLRRNLSGKFFVEINGKFFRSVSSICMDAFFVEIDNSVKVGDRVSVMQNAEEMAKILGTIPYEILTGFSNFRGKTIIQ